MSRMEQSRTAFETENMVTLGPSTGI